MSGQMPGIRWWLDLVLVWVGRTSLIAPIAGGIYGAGLGFGIIAGADDRVISDVVVVTLVGALYGALTAVVFVAVPIGIVAGVAAALTARRGGSARQVRLAVGFTVGVVGAITMAGVSIWALSWAVWEVIAALVVPYLVMVAVTARLAIEPAIDSTLELVEEARSAD